MQPCTNLRLEMQVIDPYASFFVLDNSTLDDPDTFLAPTPLPNTSTEDTFVLDVSRLDSTTDLLQGIGYAPEGYVWLDVTSTTMFIDIDRGLDTTRSVTARPIAGQLVASIVDPYLDALSNSFLGINTPIRLRVDQDLVFQGSTTTLRTTYDATGVPTLELTASDAIARLNSVTMAARSSESYQNRMAAIASTASIESYIDTTGGETLTQTQDETNALELLYATQDSEGGLVWIDRWNKLHALTRGDESVVGASAQYLFSNDHSVSNHYCMSAFATGMDTDQVINQITFNNLEYNTTDARFETNQYTYSDNTSAAYYGVRKQFLSTTLDPADLSSYAETIFNTWAVAGRKVRNIAAPIDDFQDSTVKEITYIDIGDVVEIYLNDPINTTLNELSETRRVAQISHRITPTLWEMQLTLL